MPIMCGPTRGCSANQQPFDWAIVQSEALAQFASLDLPLPAKVITFSANNRRADIYMERGLLISRLPDGPGRCWTWTNASCTACTTPRTSWPRWPWGTCSACPWKRWPTRLKTRPAGGHRFELVAEINGVKFINDAKATNVDALHQALHSLSAAGGPANVWLIAGGKDKGLEYHDVGPILSQRVKGAFLIGEAPGKNSGGLEPFLLLAH